MKNKLFWLFTICLLYGFQCYAADTTEVSAFHSFQEPTNNLGIGVSFCKNPKFISDNTGTPPDVPFNPGICIFYSREKGISNKYNLSFGFALGIQPLSRNFEFPLSLLDSNATEDDYFSDGISSIASPYFQPELSIHRLLKYKEKKIFSFDLGIQARLYFPFSVETDAEYHIDSITSKTFYVESIDFAFSKSVLIQIKAGISKKVKMKNGGTRTLFASCILPINKNHIGDYVYLAETSAYSYGKVYTSNPSIVFGIAYSIGGKKPQE